MSVRTSHSHPIHVDWLALPYPGRVGLTFAPGKVQPSLTYAGERWERDLDADLDRLAHHHGARVVVCLLEDHEFEALRIPSFAAAVATRGLALRRLPIPDGGVLPDLAPMRALVAEIRQHVAAGHNVVIHCAGGLGRTGTVAGCLLVDEGLAPDDAVALLNEVRDPRCPENPTQKDFIARYAREGPR